MNTGAGHAKTKHEQTLHGYLVLADISGFTSYLAEVELTHAQDILTDLLERIVQQFRPVLIISKLEGDAVFAHAPQSRLQRGEALLELLEATYLAFRDRVESIRRRTTCQCNACRSIPHLDLKFIVHFGEYLLQQVSEIHELVGSDVNLAHRLLKNHVSETTGWKAYALFTEAALEQMGIHPEGMHDQVEPYDHLGEVKTFSLDLHTRYQELTDKRQVRVMPEQAHSILTHILPAPPAIVWEWLNDVPRRRQWGGLDDVLPVLRPGGRTTGGARNHCLHGKNVIQEDILDWRPFEYYTTGYSQLIQTTVLEPLEEETRLSIYSRLNSPLPGWLARLVARWMMGQFKLEEGLDRMESLISAEYARSKNPENSQ